MKFLHNVACQKLCLKISPSFMQLAYLKNKSGTFLEERCKLIVIDFGKCWKNTFSNDCFSSKCRS